VACLELFLTSLTLKLSKMSKRSALWLQFSLPHSVSSFLHPISHSLSPLHLERFVFYEKIRTIYSSKQNHTLSLLYDIGHLNSEDSQVWERISFTFCFYCTYQGSLCWLNLYRKKWEWNNSELNNKLIIP
jgi:hypothetical protein